MRGECYACEEVGDDLVRLDVLHGGVRFPVWVHVWCVSAWSEDAVSHGSKVETVQVRGGLL